MEGIGIFIFLGVKIYGFIDFWIFVFFCQFIHGQEIHLNTCDKWFYFFKCNCKECKESKDSILQKQNTQKKLI